jgi:hypothetical protein
MITTPFSVALGRDEDAIDIVEGTSTDPIPGKIRVWLGADVNPGNVQVYIGSLRACFRHLMNESARHGVVGNEVAFGDWQNASAGNILIEGDSTSLTVNHVAIIVSSSFAVAGATQFYTETFNQLMNGLLERVSAN